MPRFKNEEKGMSLFGMSVVCIFLGLIIVVGLKIIPIYIENITVVSALKSLQEDAAHIEMTGIKTRLMKNFQINNITNVHKSDITIKKLPHKKKEITIEYEVRRSVMGNVDVVIQFSERIELSY